MALKLNATLRVPSPDFESLLSVIKLLKPGGGGMLEKSLNYLKCLIPLGRIKAWGGVLLLCSKIRALGRVFPCAIPPPPGPKGSTSIRPSFP